MFAYLPEFFTLVESEDSLICLQDSAIAFYPEPVESSLHLHILLL
jgi:hypothetical protein